MHQYRLLIDLLHIAVVSDDGRALGSMVQVLQRRDIVPDVPIACGRLKFLRNLCKMPMATSEAVCTDEHVSLVLCTPAISDGDYASG